jgi:hypothetical protein
VFFGAAAAPCGAGAWRWWPGPGRGPRLGLPAAQGGAPLQPGALDLAYISRQGFFFLCKEQQKNPTLSSNSSWRIQRGRAVRRETQFRLQGELWRRGWPMQNFPPRETSWGSAPSAERPHGEAADPLPRKGAFQADSMRFERPPGGRVGFWAPGFWQAAFPPLIHHPATSQPHPPDRKPTRRMCQDPGVVKLT